MGDTQNRQPPIRKGLIRWFEGPAADKILWFGRRLAIDRKRNPEKHVGQRKIEKEFLDPLLQAGARAAECAVALDLGLDPNSALNWTIGEETPDHDITLDNGTTIEVKSAALPYPKYLIWPHRLNALFDEKCGDILVLASGMVEDKHFPVGHAQRYLTKIGFEKHHRVSDGTERPKLPIDGTWYMRAEDCWPINDLHYDGGYRSKGD